MDILSGWAKTALATHGPNVLTGIATLVVGWVTAKLLAFGLRRVLRGASRHR